MKTNELINIKRLYRLFSNELCQQARTIFIAAITLSIVLGILPLPLTNSLSVYFFVLYVGGFIVTSLAFKDIHDPNRAHLVLTLPCSNMERFLSKWLLTSVGFAIGWLALYYLLSLFSVIINTAFFNLHYPMELLHISLWTGIGKYIILQSIVLLGAIFFRKNVLLKTALTLACLLLVISILTNLFYRLFYPTYFVSHIPITIHTTLEFGHFIFWILLAPICWYLTYMKITETEIS